MAKMNGAPVLPRLIHLAREPVVGGDGAHAVREDHDGRVAVAPVCQLGEGGEVRKELIQLVWKRVIFTCISI